MRGSNSCAVPRPRKMLLVLSPINSVKEQLFAWVCREDSSLPICLVDHSNGFTSTWYNTTSFLQTQLHFFYVNIWLTVPSSLSKTQKAKGETLFRLLMVPFLKNIYFPVTEVSWDRGDMSFTKNHGSAFINFEIHPELPTPQISCLLLPRPFHPML